MSPVCCCSVLSFALHSLNSGFCSCFHCFLFLLLLLFLLLKRNGNCIIQLKVSCTVVMVAASNMSRSLSISHSSFSFDYLNCNVCVLHSNYVQMQNILDLITAFICLWTFSSERLCSVETFPLWFEKKNGFVCLNIAWMFKDRVIELQTHNALSVLVALGLFPIGKSVHSLVHTYNLLIFPLQFRYRSPSSICLSLSLSTRVPFQIAVVKIVVASQLHGKLVHLTY